MLNAGRPWRLNASAVCVSARDERPRGDPSNAIVPISHVNAEPRPAGWLPQEAEVPSCRTAAGVLNVVSGDAPAIGETLTASPTVRKITFTGSTRVGRLLLRQSADTVKRASMELGGNAPCIVFADADVAAAADAIVASGLRNAGQTCVCANRVLVEVPAPPPLPWRAWPSSTSPYLASA